MKLKCDFFIRALLFSMITVVMAGCGQKVTMQTDFIEHTYKPSLPLKYAQSFAKEHGNSFIINGSKYVFVWTYFSEGGKNRIAIAKFRMKTFSVAAEDYKAKFYLLEEKVYDYDKSIAWTNDFDINSYKKSLGGPDNVIIASHMAFTVQPNLYMLYLGYYTLRDERLIEINIFLNSSDENENPENKDFYVNIVQDMLKYDIASKEKISKDLSLPLYEEAL